VRRFQAVENTRGPIRLTLPYRQNDESWARVGTGESAEYTKMCD